MKKLSLVLALFLTSYIPSVQAQQVIPANDGTATLITPNGQRIVIDGGTLSKDGKNLFHSFQEFGLSASQIATFLSNPDIRNILSRVVGGNPSYINGLIEVMGGNSNLYLVNPAGIVFGAGARLNVPADFIATTAHQVGFANGFFNAFGANDYLNLVGSPNTFYFGDGASGAIINAGTLQVAPDSNVSLVAGNVINTGTIDAPGGKITIAAVPGTSKVKISQEGQILSLEIEPPKDTQGNSTAFRAINLPTLLTGAANQGVETELAVTPTGTVQQISTGVTLPTEPGTTIVSGTLNGTAADLGGEISILGTQVGLVNATVDASGANGGGTVLVGGDYQGKGTIPNARATYVSADSVIKADALTQGNGGKVIVWGDEATRFYGQIFARGGVLSGDGGFVETSGGYLDASGTVDASAVQGKAGTWLLDPNDITIQAIGPNLNISGNPDFTTTGNSAIITPITIQQALSTNNVTISTGTAAPNNQEGNITVNSPITYSGNAERTLTLRAANSIFVNSNITSTIAPLNVTLNADRDGSNAGGIKMNSGSSIISNGGDIVLGGGLNPNTDPAVGTPITNPIGVNLDGANLTSGDGNITINGTGYAGTGGDYGIHLSSNSQITSANGNITLKGTGGGTGSRSDGILLELGSTIQSTGNGTISLTGTGGTGVQENSGIDIRTTSKITSVDGNIILNGTGGSGSGIQNEGIILTGGSTIQSTGNGTISLTGTGGTGTDNLYGIIIGIDPSESSTIGTNSGVTSASGAITLTGTGGGTGNNNYGIFLNDSGTVESTGGNLTLIGTGGSGGLANPNEGILIQGINSRVSSSNGNINLQGALPANNTGDSIFSDASITTTGTTTIAGNNGNVALNGNNNFGTVVINSGNNVTLRDINDITLGNVNITGALTVNSPNNTQFNGTVQAGSLTTDNSIPSTTTDRTTINTSSITTTSSQTYNDPVTLNINTTFSGNNITFNNSLNVGSNSVTFTANDVLTLPATDITTTGGTNTITIQPNTTSNIFLGTNTGNGLQVTNLNSIKGFQSLTIGKPNTGTITVSNPVTFYDPTTLQAANINVNGTITGADNASITIIGAGTTTTLYADIITNGYPIRIEDNVLLGATEINLDTTNNDTVTTGADITITGKINSLLPNANSNPYSLLVEAGTTGNVTFGGAIGDTEPLDTLTIDSANQTTLNGGAVNTINDQQYKQGNVILGNNTTLTSSEGDINNSDGITGVGKNLTISANKIGIFSIDTGNGEGTINLTADLGIAAYNLTGGAIQLNAPITAILNSVTGTTLTINSVVSFFGGLPIDLNIPQFDPNIPVSPFVTVITTGSQTYNGLVAIVSSETATFTSNDTVTVNQPINTLGTDLTISANTINTDDIVTSQIDLRAFNLNSLIPNPNVTIPDFFASPLSGSITLNSNNGLIQTGNLNTANSTGADININSASTLTTGAIDTSGILGNGGNVTLNAVQDIELSSIDARSSSSTGGTVNITTPNNVRITNTIPNTNASISTEGTQAGGDITIQYDGDENLAPNQRIPFIIGDPSLNGSAGAITSGGSNINSGNFVFTERRGNVAIISVEGSNFTRDDDPGDFKAIPVAPLQATVLPPVVPVVTVEQAKSILQNIERVTAEKPAIIYVSFKPRGITLQDDFARREAALSQEYETGLNLDSNVGETTITAPSQDTHELDLLIITSEGEPVSIPIKGVIRQQVIDAAEKLYLTASDQDSSREEYEPSARQLYQWLISPLEKTLVERKIDNILFVMPAGLRIIPIAALIDGEGKFLAEKYSSGFAPSLSLNDNTYRDIKEQELLALGASQFADPDALGPLPAVQVELPTIENIWQGQQPLINEDFTINNLRQSRQKTDFGIIHLSTHGEFKPGELSSSYIQFYDRRLNLDEVRTLGLNRPPVELLVLSACRTAFGDENVELGFAGLAVKAGVKSALASLWWVGDTGTLAFMTDFYGKLKSQDVLIKAEAVRQTQIDMIQGRISQQGAQIVNPQGQITLPPDLAGAEPPDLTHPYYWAPFTLIGNPW